MRKRKKVVFARFSDEEYQLLQEKINSSGLSINRYIIDTALDYKILEPETLHVLREQSNYLRDIYIQIRGIATNINQITRKANATGNTEVLPELETYATNIEALKQEVEDIWQSQKRSIVQQRLIEE